MTTPKLTLTEVLYQALRHFVHLDESNAAIHCAPVRYHRTARTAVGVVDTARAARTITHLLRDR